MSLLSNVTDAFEALAREVAYQATHPPQGLGRSRNWEVKSYDDSLRKRREALMLALADWKDNS